MGLHSVLHVPGDSTTPIRVIHPTFAEYLLDSSLSKPDPFCVDLIPQHYTLFRRCIEVMGGLTRNLARISSPALFKTEMPNLADTLRRCIPPQVAYACLHWSTHFDISTGDGTPQGSYELLQGFLVGQMLYWIEASSFLRALDGATTALELVRYRCQVRQLRWFLGASTYTKSVLGTRRILRGAGRSARGFPSLRTDILRLHRRRPTATLLHCSRLCPSGWPHEESLRARARPSRIVSFAKRSTDSLGTLP